MGDESCGAGLLSRAAPKGLLKGSNVPWPRLMLGKFVHLDSNFQVMGFIRYMLVSVALRVAGGGILRIKFS